MIFHLIFKSADFSVYSYFTKYSRYSSKNWIIIQIQISIVKFMIVKIEFAKIIYSFLKTTFMQSFFVENENFTKSL